MTSRPPSPGAEEPEGAHFPQSFPMPEVWVVGRSFCFVREFSKLWRSKSHTDLWQRGVSYAVVWLRIFSFVFCLALIYIERLIAASDVAQHLA